MNNKISVFLLVMFIVGCSSTNLIPYQPQSISLSEANVAVEQLIMTQHRAWKPNTFLITEHYFGWGDGEIARTTANPFSATTKIHEQSERIYFNRISSVQLYDWKRKGKQFYAVSIINKDDKHVKYILRTRKLDDAKLMVNAVSTILNSK